MAVLPPGGLLFYTMDKTKQPHDKKAEQSVLGAMLKDEDTAFKIVAMLSEEMFYFPEYRKVFRSFSQLVSKGVSIDFVTMTDQLKKNGDFESIGGIHCLVEMAESVVTSANATNHAEIVQENFKKRMLIMLCDDVKKKASEAKIESKEIIMKAEDQLIRLSQDASDTSFVMVSSCFGDTIKRSQDNFSNKTGLTGLPSGLHGFDQYTSGFQNSDLIILAARPSVGKTSLALNIAKQVAFSGVPVGIFSLEMSKIQIADRILCSDAKVELHRFRTGNINRYDAGNILCSSERMKDMPLFVDDTSCLTIIDIVNRARKLKLENPSLGMIFIDYIQLISGGRGTESRQQEISAISRALKVLAKDLNIPIMACSQLSRSIEIRQDKTPKLSDLRESGAIEQDADMVVFLHREDLTGESEQGDYEAMSEFEKKQYVYKLIISKHRNGPIGEIEIFFASKYTQFYDREKKQSDSEVPF